MRLEFASVNRPAVGETVSGDAASVVGDGDAFVCAVVDGLGHGPAAAEASAAFVDYLVAHAQEPLDSIMLGAGRHISATRGAAASLMRFDPVCMQFVYCGVGNCHLHVHASERISPVSLPGIVGHRVRKVRAFESPLPSDGGLFVLCSDGVSSRLDLEQFSALPVEDLVGEIIAHAGKGHDDATVLAVRVVPSP